MSIYLQDKGVSNLIGGGHNAIGLRPDKSP